MTATGLFFDWLSGVPANVVANVIAVAIGVAATRLWGKVAHRRIWSLADPAKLVIFVAEDSMEAVRKGSTSYVRPATGVGQARALALIAPSLRSAYRDVDLGKVLMAGEGIERDRKSDLITLGGAKNNLVTREIMNALSMRYVVAAPSPQEGLAWIKRGEGLELYEPEGGREGDHVTRNDRIERDYGVIVKAPSPWNPDATVVLLYGASTYGTAAAASYFVEQRRLRRPTHFTALIRVDVTGGYNGKPTLCALQALERRVPSPRDA